MTIIRKLTLNSILASAVLLTGCPASTTGGADTREQARQPVPSLAVPPAIDWAKAEAAPLALSSAPWRAPQSKKE